MLSIKATKIEFQSAHPFRKLQGLEIPLSPRITLLCGHNGVGKSTILGLLSSLSGITRGVDKSYFGKRYDASIADIVYIDYAREVATPKAAGQLSEPIIYYKIGDAELKKECSLTRRGNAARARVVARSVPHTKVICSGVAVGPDAKVPLPTIFLGMSRMLPVGESPDSRVQNTVAETWHALDEAFLLKFIKRVIPGAGAAAGEIAVNRVKYTSKLATHPSYPYGTRSVSIGQDSLGAIVTALASFQRIKRNHGDSYRGGLLVIDELDAGFHPHAIGVLVTELREVAEDLSLQIVATTHSTRLIEAIHPEGRSRSKGALGKDSVVYLRNTRAPEFDPNMGLADILQDMELTPPSTPPKPPSIKIYFEDDEACYVFNTITRKELLKDLEARHNVVIRPMPLGIGCSSLARLPSKDRHFETVVLVVDADGIPTNHIPPNLVDLPGETGPDGKGLSPERTIINYIRSLVGTSKADHQLAWDDERLVKYSQENLEENLLKDVAQSLDRKAAKAWWNEKKTYIRNWGLYEIWAQENQHLITAFELRLEAAVKVAAKARRTQEHMIKMGTDWDD